MRSANARRVCALAAVTGPALMAVGVGAGESVTAGPSTSASCWTTTTSTGSCGGLLAPCKAKTWAEIPPRGQGVEGHLVGRPRGKVAIGHDQSRAKVSPTPLTSLLDPRYEGVIGINGSPLSAGPAQATVYAPRVWEELLCSTTGQNPWLEGETRPVKPPYLERIGKASKAALAKLTSRAGSLATELAIPAQLGPSDAPLEKGRTRLVG